MSPEPARESARGIYGSKNSMYRSADTLLFIINVFEWTQAATVNDSWQASGNKHYFEMKER